MDTIVNSYAWTALGAVVATATTGSLLYASHLAARRFFADDSACARWVATAILAAWLVVVLSIVLIFSWLYTAPVAAVLAVAIALLARRLWGERYALGQELRGIRSFIRPLAEGRGAMLLLAAAFTLLLQASRAILMPPLAWDSLTYHLTLASLWIQNGGHARLLAPDAWGDYSHYPNNGEVFLGWLMLPFRGDLLANLVNFPFLVLGAAAVYGLAREIGAGRDESLLAAALVAFSPPLFSYVTTGYVDVQVMAEEIAAALFLVRFARARRPQDCVFAAMALGLAAGTKVLSIVPLLVGAAIIIAVLFGKRREQSERSERRALLFILAPVMAAIVSLPWYLRNWIETGSPVYPFPINLGGAQLFAGSPYIEAALEIVRSRPIPEYMFWLNSIIYIPEDIAMSFGPKLIVVAIVGFVGLCSGLRQPPRAAWLIVSVLFFAGAALFLSDSMKSAKWFWPELSLRFFTTPFALLTAVAAVAISRAGPGERRIEPSERQTEHSAPMERGKQYVVAVLACFVIWDLLLTNTAAGSRGAALTFAITVGGALAVIAFGYHWFEQVSKASAQVRADGFNMHPINSRGAPPIGKAGEPRRVLALLAVVSITFLMALQQYRDATRHHYYANASDLHDIPRGQVAGWKLMDNPSRPATIAFVAGWEFPGHNWAIYPLMGRRLQNRVTYVPTTRSGELPSYFPVLDVAEKLEATEWIQRLRSTSADYFFVALPEKGSAPPELAWAERDNNALTLVQASEGYRIYAVK